MVERPRCVEVSAEVSERDQLIVSSQLGRPARGVRSVAHRCPCGNPDVVETASRLPDGTPFPTVFYLTCPKASSLIGTLEASGKMAEMTQRLSDDPALAASYLAAHRSYLERRSVHGEVPEIEGISAGGMPTRVKCLHVLVGQSLAQGPGINPFGDEALAMLADWWADGPCASASADGPCGSADEPCASEDGPRVSEDGPR